MVTLVTGATGFLGRHLVGRLRSRGDDVWGVSRSGDARDGRLLALDLADAGACREAIARLKPSVVFHLAGVRSASLDEMRRAQVAGTLSLLDALGHAASCSKLVLVGSAAEYGPVPADRQPIDEAEPCIPVSDYGRTKHEAVLAALAFGRRHDVAVHVARPFNVVGPGMPRGLIVRDLIDRLTTLDERPGAELHTGRLDTSRDFVDVGDAARALELIERRGRPGEIYNVCSGVATRISDLVQRLLRVSGRSARVVEAAADRAACDVPIAYGNTDKARKELGFVAEVDLDRSLVNAWQYFSRVVAA